MWPLVRQARYLGRYQQIAQVLVRHGFGYLVEQLGLTQLLSLPRRLVRGPSPDPLSGPERLRQALITLGPTFVKLGQMLSTRPDILPPAFMAELSKLQDTVPPFPADQAIAIIEAELGRPLDQLYRSFEREPLAAGSLGQVHAAVLHDGSQVVVKVQRPAIQQTVAVDLSILNDLAALAQERTALGQQYNLVELAWEVGATLRAELDYRREGHNADRFRKNFAATPGAYVPTVYWEHTGGRVLTIERLFGVKINDLAGLDAAGIDRRQLAQHSTSLILQEIFQDGFFHADPHPGNFFALAGPRVGLIDFGQVVSLDRETTVDLLLLLVALSRRDSAGMLQAMQRLDIVSPRQLTSALQRDMQRLVERLVDRPLEELSARETNDELLALIARHRLRLPASMALLFKAIVMMEGVGIQLDPKLDTFALARPYAAAALAELASPEMVARRTLRQAQELASMAGALPRQLGDVLQQLGDGDLRITTRDEETRRLALALSQAGTRLALALAMVAWAVVLGLLVVSAALGLAGAALTGLMVGATVALVTTGLALLVHVASRGE